MLRHMPERIAAPQAEHHLDLLPESVSAGTVTFVDHVDVGDLHHACLERLDAIARLRHQDQHRRLGGTGDVELRLSDPHGLDQDALEPKRLEQISHFLGRGREAAA